MILDKNDLLLIENAKSKGGNNVWNDSILDNVKKKIKNYYRGTDGGKCCYCREGFKGEFSLVIDIEHVLPKSIFPNFLFDLFNLNIACKRCNMSIKRNRIDFLVDESTIHLKPLHSDQYKFIHPNLDKYEENLGVFVLTCDDRRIIKYVPHKPKGEFTYKYFELEKKEIITLDLAQGIDVTNTEFQLSIPKHLIPTLSKIIAQL